MKGISAIGGGGQGFRWRRVLGSVLLAAAMITTPPALAQSYRFSGVTVEGNQRIEPRTILNHARIGRGEAMSPADMNDAYQRLINSGLFETVELAPRGGTLVIRVKEFPTINLVNFEGNRRLKPEQLTELINSRPRHIYSPTTAEGDAAAIAEAYSQTGNLAARVTPRIIRRSDNRVDLVFEIAEGRLTEVERLSFVGNRNFTSRRLRQVLATKQAGLLRQFISSGTYVADRIDLDRQLLTDFYRSRGFIDFQVMDATAEVQRERDGFFVTFTVREGLQYRLGQMRVVSEIDGVDAADYEPLLRLRTGNVYSPADVENAIARMETLASRRGVNFLRAEPRVRRNDRDQILDIDFALVRGERIFVERIDIEGNTTTLDQVIRRQFRTVEGDPLNPREIRAAAERIRALGYFENAEVEATEGASGEGMIVKTTVTEKPTGSLSFGGSYSRSSGFGLAVGLTESNFLGRGQYLGLHIATGEAYATSDLTFIEPALLGRDLKFTFEGLYSQTEADFATWDTRLAQVSLGLEFPLSETTRLEARYALSRSRLFKVPGFAPGRPPNYLDPIVPWAAKSSPILAREQARGSLWGSGLGYELSWDSRRRGFEDRTAYVMRFGQMLYGAGGDLRFLRSELFAGAQTSVLSGAVNLRAEFEAGAITSRRGGVRATERFFLDGKLRGFEPFGLGPRDMASGRQDPLGGKTYAVARLEADFPVGLPEEYGIRGAAFLDVGSIWGLDDRVGTGGTLVDDGRHLRSAVGVSLLWDAPIGPLRFNFTRALKKQPYDREQRFDLTISTRF